MLCNTGFAYFLQDLNNSNNGQWYVYGIGLIGLGILLTRFSGAMLYLVHEGCCKKKMKKRSSRKIVPITKELEIDKSIERKNEYLKTSPFAEEEKFFKLEDEPVKINDNNHKNQSSFHKKEPSIPIGMKLDVDNVLVEDSVPEESISELSILMRQKRFKKGMRLTQLSKDTGIDISRLRDIEEGKAIQTIAEKKIIAMKLV